MIKMYFFSIFFFYSSNSSSALKQRFKHCGQVCFCSVENGTPGPRLDRCVFAKGVGQATKVRLVLQQASWESMNH